MSETKTLRERLEGCTINGTDVIIEIERQVATEIERSATDEVYEKSKGLHKPITTKFNSNLSGERSERRDSVAKTSLSEEALLHQTFLHNSKGGKMDNSPLQTRGPIELALDEARKKSGFYLSQVEQNRKEFDKWEAAVKALELTLGIVTGKVQANGEVKEVVRRGPRKRWDEILVEMFKEGHPLSRRVFFDYCENTLNMPKTSVYANFGKLKERGKLIENAQGLLVPDFELKPEKKEAEVA